MQRTFNVLGDEQKSLDFHEQTGFFVKFSDHGLFESLAKTHFTARR